jgi:hypothetical protein
MKISAVKSDYTPFDHKWVINGGYSPPQRSRAALGHPSHVESMRLADRTPTSIDPDLPC